MQKFKLIVKKEERFVDYDKIYVNFVMLTMFVLKHLFLPFSLIMTISSVFGVLLSLNIGFAIFLSCLIQWVSCNYLLKIFVHIYERRFFLRLLSSFFSAQ